MNSRSDTLLRLLSSFILLASLLILPKADAAVGNTFTVDQLKYTILTEEPASQTGTVFVETTSSTISGDLVIPASVLNEGFSYSVSAVTDFGFRDCTNLTSVVIPDSVTKLGIYAFYNCGGLTNVVIPNSVTEIGTYAFYDCRKLPSVVIPNGMTSIAINTFYNCWKLTNVVIPDSVTTIGPGAFQHCEILPSIVFPNSVTSIDQYAFAYCTLLTNVVIPESVTSIGKYAFQHCGSLKSIVIPKSVTSIGGYSFSSCGVLTAVYFEGNAPALVGGKAFHFPAIIYYKAGTTGWTDPWSDRPVTLWVETPEITEQPQSQAVMEGDSVTFSVSAAGAEPLSYQWYKDGALLEGATGASYTIESVNVGDLGSYTVVVSNELGETTSTPATLTLKTPYRATGTVQVVDGSVVVLTITDGGWGYTRAPNIRIIDETGTGASAHCVIENGALTQIIIDNPGSNYSGEATILIGSPINDISLEISVSKQNAEVRVKAHLDPGMQYQLWSSVDCINWTQAGEPFTAQMEEIDILFEVENSGKFFKLQEI